MRLDAIFNILYIPCKFKKTLKENNLIDRKKCHKQLTNKWISSFSHWNNKTLCFNNQINNPVNNILHSKQ